MSGGARIALRLEQPAHYADHRFEGAAVLPAVESLQALARQVHARWPALRGGPTLDARFMRFLPTEPGGPPLEAEADLTPVRGGVRASLVTVRRLKAGMSRTLEHVVVTFSAPDEGEPMVPAEPDPAALGEPFQLRRRDLYRDLVPFGPGYHNARTPVELRPELAAGPVRCPGLPCGAPLPLGSPFPLDAALHLACAWGQRYHGVVTFPVGYARRDLPRPTALGGSYRARVQPLEPAGPGTLRFDILISDEQGVREGLRGVVMEDVSRGRLRPPAWVVAP